MKNKQRKTAILAAAMAVVMLTGCGKGPSQVRDLDTSKYVTLGQYSGLVVEVNPLVEVTEQMVTDYINSSILASRGEVVDITDRAVQDNDTVSYTCVGTVDGEVFEGGSTAEGSEWETLIGSGTMIDGFEDGFIGMEIGETKDIVCTFPDPYNPNPDLSGREAVFTVTVSSIKTTIYPELTDEILTELGSSYATTAEARQGSREYLEAQAQTAYEDNIENEIISAVLVNCEFNADPPKFLLDRNIEAFRANFEMYASMYGMDLNTFLIQLVGITEEQFNEEAQTIAIAACQETLAFEAIADAEGLSDISEEELMQEAEDYVANSGYYTSTDDLFTDVDKDSFRDYLVSQRVIAWLLENNTTVDRAAE